MASWMFGRGNTQNQNQYPQNFNEFVPPVIGGGGQGGDDNNDKNKNKQMEAYRFDSSALERAAKAAKDLENSKFAAQALELSKEQVALEKQQEATRMQELKNQMEASRQQHDRASNEERRKNMEHQAKLDARNAELQDKYARQRQAESLEQKRQLDDERRRKDEESVAKIEAQKRATSEHDRKLEYEYKRQVKVESIKQKAESDRKNHDIKMEQLKLEAEQSRLTTIESLKEKRETMVSALTIATSSIGAGLNAFISDPNKIFYTVGGLVALTTGYFASKGAFGVFYRTVEARIAVPSLLRQTSKITPIEFLKHPTLPFKRLREKPKDVMENVVFEDYLEIKCRDIAVATKNTKINKGNFRNILLHGPPGTGKTLFAKQLALHSHMDYAIMTGGDVSMLKGDGVTAIHKVFDWAEVSNKGLVLFIDEAEAFLCNRNENMSENVRMALSAFLSRTGTPSDKFMLVITSNTPEILDSAMLDRIHKQIKFPLPALKERKRLVKLYLDKYILHPASEGKKRIKIENKFLENVKMLQNVCDQVAELTEGMSAREINNLALDWQMSTYESVDATLTEKIIFDIVDDAVKSNKEKIIWNKWKGGVFSQAVVNAVRKSEEEKSSSLHPPKSN